MLNAHLQDRRHYNCVSGRSVLYYCSLCKTNLASANWDQHIGGVKHQTRAILYNVAPDVEPLQGGDVGNQRYCNICKQATPSRRWEGHQRSPKHQMREKYALYRAALDEAEKDKNGIVVEGNFDFDFVDPTDAAVGVHSTIFLKTATPNLRVRLISLNRVSSRAGTDKTSVRVLHLFLKLTKLSSFSVVPEGYNRDITPRLSVKIIVTLRQMYIGRYEDRLEMTFEDIQLKKRFLISRAINAVVGNKEEHEKLKATAPYIPRRRTERKPETRIIEGVRPPALNAIPYVGKLPQAAIPRDLLAMLSDGSVKETVNRLRRAYLPGILDSDSFARHFRTLIWIEEQRSE